MDFKKETDQKKNDSPQLSNFRQIFEEEIRTNRPSRLAFNQYLIAAYEYQKKLTTSPERFRTPLWSFTRLLSGHAHLSSMSAQDALYETETQLHRVLHGSWKSLFRDVLSDDDARMEFIDVWDRILYRPGYSPLDKATEMADRIEVIVKNCPTLGYKRFVAIAAALQQIRYGQTILLPCHKLAEKMGCTPMTISRYRQVAIKNGVLQVAKSHRYSKTSPEATQFRVNLEILGLPPW